MCIEEKEEKEKEFFGIFNSGTIDNNGCWA